jgi:AraC family ethanolamine operon transcriptional activator
MDQPFLLHRHFDDFDDYCVNARNWDLDYRQIESGHFSGELLMAGNGTALLTRAKLGRKMIQKGATPRGMITIGILADPGISLYWRNIDISGDVLFVFPENGELDSISQDDFDVFAISMAEEKLNQSCNLLELPDIRALINNDEAFLCNPYKLGQLRAWLSSTVHNLASMAGSGLSTAYMQHIEQELADKLISVIADRHQPVRRKSIRKRDIALLTAKNYIAESDVGTLTVSELCKVAEVSERTLEYAFRERYGLTPKNYLQLHLLNNVRRQLRMADPKNCQVTEIARQHGFWHMGAFGADYKKLFAELPSETLKYPR